MKVIEPLAESAPLALALSHKFCSKCSWYHGFWQYLRLLGVGKTLSGQAIFFEETIKNACAKPNLDILISGCADYSMLAHIEQTLICFGRKLDESVNIIALDICSTPLNLCQWYANRNHFRIDTVQADILSFDLNKKFDLIITSSFLGYFNEKNRLRLFQKCAKLLKTGGSLSFANRISTESIEAVNKFTENDARALQKKLLELNKCFPDTIRIPETSLPGMVKNYCMEMKSYPVNDTVKLKNQLEAAGLHLLIYEERFPDLPHGISNGGLSGPTLAFKTPYICVEAILGR